MVDDRRHGSLTSYSDRCNALSDVAEGIEMRTILMAVMLITGVSLVCRETWAWIMRPEAVRSFDFLFFMFSSSMAALLRDWLGGRRE